MAWLFQQEELLQNNQPCTHTMWSQVDETAYRPLCCSCCRAWLGARILSSNNPQVKDFTNFVWIASDMVSTIQPVFTPRKNSRIPETSQISQSSSPFSGTNTRSMSMSQSTPMRLSLTPSNRHFSQPLPQVQKQRQQHNYQQQHQQQLHQQQQHKQPVPVLHHQQQHRPLPSFRKASDLVAGQSNIRTNANESSSSSSNHLQPRNASGLSTLPSHFHSQPCTRPSIPHPQSTFSNNNNNTNPLCSTSTNNKLSNTTKTPFVMSTGTLSVGSGGHSSNSKNIIDKYTAMTTMTAMTGMNPSTNSSSNSYGYNNNISSSTVNQGFGQKKSVIQPPQQQQQQLIGTPPQPQSQWMGFNVPKSPENNHSYRPISPPWQRPRVQRGPDV
eukprot:TRINITY_DN278_c0_g1_i1.p1 TRINITY_DN278_c0_g1~~TRINITY_DN278_c0_g1_i1.p1  ORF type:complete len:417 (+),score=130.60 TRINITY_DN278_c0_g1_i1:101-1252(+)